jgi:uncharacterized protein (TIGR02147 family)
MEDYRQILKNDFINRQRKNESFSLRAYSKFLGISPATLSEVMRERRNLPQKYADVVANKLNLGPIEKQLFLKSILIQKRSLKDLVKLKIEDKSQTILDEQRDFNIIAHWEYYGFLNLIETHDFQNNTAWISQKLSISKLRVKQVKDELLHAGHIEEKNNILVRKKVNLNTTQDVVSKAIRQSHKESLEMAIDKIESVDISKRFYSSSTVPVSIDKLDEAKELIRDFREKLCALLQEGKKEEVYNLNIQLYPLTNTTTTN